MARLEVGTGNDIEHAQARGGRPGNVDLIEDALGNTVGWALSKANAPEPKVGTARQHGKERSAWGSRQFQANLVENFCQRGPPLIEMAADAIVIGDAPL
jgi:hypothetical protein